MSTTTYEPQGRQAYDATLQRLSEASVEVHFQAFKDIDWDNPEFAVDPNDERWILPAVDPLGGHPWYRSLPKERQVQIGRHRLVAMTKTGTQFEQLLLLGGTQFLMGLENGNPEFRYFMHELTEETHHIQMFQEFTNRACPEVSGAPQWLMTTIPLIGMLGSWWPTLFFQIILAGEEPIDHLQKDVLRAGGTHPLLNRLMAIHAAEEARHIGFAHAWLEHHTPSMNIVNKMALGLMVPLVLRLGFGAIVIPSKADQKMMGIPDEVMREVFGRRNADMNKVRRDVCADVRMLCEQVGVLNAVTRPVWKLWGVDGRAARFRSEPASARD
ncbi:AurF N-oxygenase family protein [Nocardioides sp. Kera G14]|uniref:AurF N-oxygenase family protein n=1 Tax=Nocardioides sp. Kera G14 TaxID=2884264 RepID=UPI001D12FF7F|nr:diiron oxygenase [Nocardioides sp. Kera G14]UDY23511.1 diiron oxygenase [Nocardioides sp. Kera G14]